MDVQLTFGVLGTLAGVVYAVLGIAALKHLSQATEADRTAGWMLWWFTERARYDEVGQRLCSLGAAVFLLGAASWVAAIAFRI